MLLTRLAQSARAIFASLLPTGAAVMIVAALLSCSSSVNTMPASTRAPSATPIALPSSSPVTAVQQQLVVLSAATAEATPLAVVLPSAAGFSPVMLLPLPQTATNAQLTVLVSNVAPSSSPPLSLARLAQAVRRTSALPAGAAVLLYDEIYSTATLTLPTAPGFTFAIPSAYVFGDANYYLALYDPARPSLAWQYGFEGPATVTGTSIAFAPNAAPFALTANLGYYFALYVIPQGSTQPTPAPSISPTSVPAQTPPASTPTPLPAPSSTGEGGLITITVPTPSPVMCTPAPVTVAVGMTAALACAAQGYGGALSWTVADPAIASVGQATLQDYASLNVTGHMAGTTTLSLQTQSGGAGSVTIVVILPTTTPLTTKDGL